MKSLWNAWAAAGIGGTDSGPDIDGQVTLTVGAGETRDRRRVILATAGERIEVGLWARGVGRVWITRLGSDVEVAGVTINSAAARPYRLAYTVPGNVVAETYVVRVGVAAGPATLTMRDLSLQAPRAMPPIVRDGLGYDAAGRPALFAAGVPVVSLTDAGEVVDPATGSLIIAGGGVVTPASTREQAPYQHRAGRLLRLLDGEGGLMLAVSNGVTYCHPLTGLPVRISPAYGQIPGLPAGVLVEGLAAAGARIEFEVSLPAPQTVAPSSTATTTPTFSGTAAPGGRVDVEITGAQ